jgi:hypothetical protein
MKNKPRVAKHVTINLGNYETLKLGVEDTPNYEEADIIIVDELKRLGIPISDKIKRCLGWKQGVDNWM